MSITSIETVRTKNTNVVSAVSSLAGAAFYWYVDGQFVGSTSGGVRSFVTAAGEQSQVDVLDSIDPAFDPVANTPAVYPSRRTLSWIRSMDAGAARYRVEQSVSGGAYTTLGFVAHDPRRWSYAFLTPQLSDLTLYAWRVVPIDRAGNDMTAVGLGTEMIVRRPDAPNFAIAFNAGTTKVTIAGAP